MNILEECGIPTRRASARRQAVYLEVVIGLINRLLYIVIILYLNGIKLILVLFISRAHI